MERSGRRAPWAAVPSDVLAALGRELGGALTPGPLAAGGFSPGPAGPCALPDGSRVFVKACGSALNPSTPGMIRREAAVLATLPADAPAPRVLALVDDGDWVALAVEHVAGASPQAPLAADAVARTLALVTRLAATALPADTDLPLAFAHDHDTLWAWRALAGDGALADRLDPWSRRHLDALVALEAGWPEATEGAALVHGDLRTDNVVLSPDGGGVIVDWPSAGVGPPWLDLVGLLPSFHLDGAPPPGQVFDAHAVGRAAPADRVDCFVAALAGYFTRQALLPPPPGLPTLRSFQAAQGVVTRGWLAERAALA